jgi:hypothetical protein
MGVVSEIYDGSGAKPVSWGEVGETIEGEILAIRTKQLPKFGTEIPETWDDGSAKFTPIVTVQTADGDEDSEDDGKRDVYLRSNAYTAFGKALREAFKSKPEDGDLVGCHLKIQFFKTEKSGKGQPRKLFRARITRKSATADAWDDADKPQGDRTPAGAPARTAKPAPSGRPAAMPPGHPAGEDPDGIPF